MDALLAQVPAFKESRLQSLYLDFSHLQELNPEGFDANIAAWSHLLDTCLDTRYFHSAFTLPGAEMAAKLAHSKYGQPKGLATVLDCEIQNGKYAPWSIYKFSSPEPLWSLKDYLSPMRWVERRLRAYRVENFRLLDGKGGVCGDYFIQWGKMAVLGDRLGAQLAAKVLSEGTYLAKLLDSDLFADLVRGVDSTLSDLDIQVLLIYLSRDTGKLRVVSDYENARRTFIKVDNSDITSADIGVIKVKANIKSLQDRSDILAHRLDQEIPQKIAELLKKDKHDDRLKNVLVQKSYLTRSLNKCLGLVSQLNMILDKINDAEGNVSMFETLKTAKDVLASFNNKISFADLDKVQLELDDEIAVSNELTEAMVISPDLDERAIDDELELLEREYEKEQEEKNVETESKSGVSGGKVEAGKGNAVESNTAETKDVETKDVETKAVETTDSDTAEAGVTKAEEGTKEESVETPESSAQSDGTQDESDELVDRLLRLKLPESVPTPEAEKAGTPAQLA